jgi:hypothetical protein
VDDLVNGKEQILPLQDRPEITTHFEVGYGRPPRETQFVKGTSGNPKGRPKGARGISTIFHAIAHERIRVNSNGRERSVPRIEGILYQLTARALKGEMSAIRESLRLHLKVEEEMFDALEPISQERDDEMMESLLKRNVADHMKGESK